VRSVGPRSRRSACWARGFWRRSTACLRIEPSANGYALDLLFQWFLDLELEEEPFDASTFSKNQQRLLEHQVADEFFAEVVGLLKERRLLSEEHFSVDGTLIEAWASLKSFRPKDEGDPGPKDGNGWGDFSGQKRSNDTHESKSDAEAKLLKKGAGKEAKLCFTAHAVMENRHGFCVSLELTPSVGVTESDMALEQLKHLQAEGFSPKSVGPTKVTTTARLWRAVRANRLKPMWPGSRAAKRPA
jgi:hypothetical protein